MDLSNKVRRLWRKLRPAKPEPPGDPYALVGAPKKPRPPHRSGAVAQQEPEH